MSLFIRMSIWDRILEAIFPARRRARQARVREGIRWLVENPEEPVNYR